MRRFLIVLMVQSILVIAQSGVAMMPSPIATSTSIELDGLANAAGLVAGQPEIAAIGGLPEPLALFLLLAGLSGLAAAGTRPARSHEAARFQA